MVLWSVLVAGAKSLNDETFAIAGFLIWLATVFALLNATKLRRFQWELVSFIVGIHVCTTHTTLYLLMCHAGLLPVLVVVLTEDWEGWLNMSVDFVPPCLRIAVRTIVTFALRKDCWQLRARLVLLLSWCGAAMPWTWVVRLMLAVVFSNLLHLVVLLHLDLTNDDFDTVPDLWVAVRSKMRVRLPVMAGLVVCWSLFVITGHIAKVFLTVAVLISAASIILCWDKSLTNDIKSTAKPMFQTLEPLMQTFGTERARLLSADMSALEHFVKELRSEKVRTVLPWAAASSLVGLLTVVLASRFSNMWGVLLFAFLVSSAYASTPHDCTLGRATGVLAGLLAILSLQFMLMGCVLGMAVGAPGSIMIVGWDFVVKVIWFWMAVLLVLVQTIPYLGQLWLRRILLDTWWANVKQRNPPTSITVPYEKELILAKTLYELMNQAPHSNFHVEFSGRHPFNLDAIDMGGLTKAWASQLSRSLVLPLRIHDHELIWTMVEKWDANSGVYHLNYQAQWANEHQHMLDDDVAEDILPLFTQLGAVVGRCLLNKFPLIKLSRALFKFLLRDEGSSKEAKYAVSFEDLMEVLPTMAQTMMDPERRQHVDFSEVSMPQSLNLKEEGLVVRTNFSNEFHPPATPSAAEWDELARCILESDLLLPYLEAMRVGFRGVLSLRTQGLLLPHEAQQWLGGGDRDIDVADWRRHTVYLDGASEHHPVVQAFWKCMQGRTQDHLQAFLEWVTGSKCLPHGGFSQLSPIFKLSVVNNLQSIRAHTCFNTVDVPSRIDLTALKMAIDSVCRP